jgi:MoxR-like ATPase
MTADARTLLAPDRVAAGQAQIARLVGELRRVILGKEDTIDEVVAALLAGGHVLIEGLPGLGKTELVKALSRLLSLDFRRIQFTPDLLPTDITGSHILQERDGRKEFVFHPGPVFTNLLLADEINRASPKTQAALLEAMQERRVTTFGETRPLPRPFFVLATQNPIELEGTYPLPEAQLDRFMFKVDIAGVDRAVLEEILVTRVHGEPPSLEPVLAAGDLDDLFSLVDAVHLPRSVANYIARLVAASHPTCADAPEAVRTFVKYGSSPRAAISIGAASRGLALLRGKPNVGFDEVRRVVAPAMAHRLVLDYAARLEGWDGRRVVGALLEAVPEIERGLPPTLEAQGT